MATIVTDAFLAQARKIRLEDPVVPTATERPNLPFGIPRDQLDLRGSRRKPPGNSYLIGPFYFDAEP